MVVSEVGIVTSVGRDAHTTLTSILAGIARPKELGYFAIVDPELQEPQGVVGHPIEALTEGFHLYGLWLRVGLKCLEDLLSRAGLERGPQVWQRGALIAVAPDIRSERFMSEGDESPEALREPYLDRIAGWLGVPAERVKAVAVGPTGLYQALELAGRALERQDVDRVAILAVDSLLDTLSLEWLAEHDRLKTPAVPAGLMPGEAGVALLIERPGAKGLGVSVRAIASEAPPPRGAPAGGADPAWQTSVERGARLAQVLERCLARAPRGDGAARMLVSDQNGEQWRAEELAHCSLKLGDLWPADAELLLPALSVGDTGAARAALGCGIAALALKHGEARESIVLTSTFDGAAGAALLTAA